MAAEHKRWIPLESNPEILSTFLHNLGFSSDYAFCDIYGTDPDLLAMVPTPVVAVILLYPITDKTESGRQAQEQKLIDEGKSSAPGVFFMRQTIGNACGTIGLLHASGNSPHLAVPGGFLHRFLEKTLGQTSAERGKVLEEDMEIENIHGTLSQQGQSTVPDIADDTNLHFIAFVTKDGVLYELDGRKPFPIQHGPSKADTFLQDAVAVIQSEFMCKDPDEVRFTMLALASAQ
uniref:Ubiquitin carboxyl-terminal hydrolase n=1 Tax=Cyanoptyche gloeocystis TaxID=77922 RepID=A0A7S2NNK9_9EUKA